MTALSQPQPTTGHRSPPGLSLYDLEIFGVSYGRGLAKLILNVNQSLITNGKPMQGRKKEKKCYNIFKDFIY